MRKVADMPSYGEPGEIVITAVIARLPFTYGGDDPGALLGEAFRRAGTYVSEQERTDRDWEAKAEFQFGEAIYTVVGASTRE